MWRDPLGLSTLLMVYSAMIIGNVLFVYTVAWPTLAGHQSHPGVIVSVVVELLIFESLWFMMLWSHQATMCRDPGFIPKRYSYD